MYSLVDVDPKKEYGVTRLPEWKTVQDGLTRNLRMVLNHFRHTSYSVAADHLLVQILQSIDVPLSLNSERYYNNISFDALVTANTFQLTTPFGVGKVFKGVFFNKAIKEVIIGFDEAFNYAKVEADWQNATPVRVLRHPFTHLDLQVPNGKVASPQLGLAVIAVNVSLLAFQYRAFYQAEIAKQKRDPTYVQRNIMQFMHMYVLPNMLESYLDYALFNRFNHLWLNKPMYSYSNREVVHVPDYTKLVNSVYKRQIEIIQRSSYSAPATLAAMPAASVPDMRPVMFVPDVVPTRQILWSVILSRLPMLLFLVRAAQGNERVQNQNGLLGVETTLLRLKNQRVLDSVLPKELYQPTMDAIDEILGAL